MNEYSSSVDYFVVKEQYLAKKKEVEWKQREEKLLFSEFVRVSKNYALDNLRGCATYYFEEWKDFLSRKDKLSRKEKKTCEAYRSVFCESFFPESMKGVEITEIYSYGWDCVGREFYFDLNGKEYGIYIPCPENITERNFASFFDDVSEFEVILHEGALHTVLINTHDLSKIREFLAGLVGKKKRGRPKKNGI